MTCVFSFHSIEYHLENKNFPLWEHCSGYKEYPISEVAKLLLGTDVAAERVCSSVPIGVHSSASFIVSMKNVKDPMDLRADGNGVWEHKGLRSLWVSVSGHKVEILSRKGRPNFKLGGSAKMFCIKKAYHSLQSSSDFRRLIVTMEGKYSLYCCKYLRMHPPLCRIPNSNGVH